VNAVLSRLWLWGWHLLPANPILVRVVQGGSRRPRHLWLRAGYLSILLMVISFSLLSYTAGQDASLDKLAKGASQTFKWASITQLALICFLAPAFTASAITQERDAQTFNILLSTPLTSGQIVFGSLMSRLFFVILLLLAGLPIFLMTMLYGGVTTSQIMESFILSGATAILTGALAIFVAMAGVGTRRTIFSFYLLIALYLLIVYVLGTWNSTWVDAAPANIDGEKMSWLTPFHPFLALNVALNTVQAPSPAQLAGYSAISRYALANPSGFYVMWTLGLALLLTVSSIAFVRRGVKTGEPTILTALLGRFTSRDQGDRTRKPRMVWKNPVAWREAKTKTTSGSWLRWLILVAGLVTTGGLLWFYWDNGITSKELRIGIAAITVIQFVLSILFATNTAATSMTKEKEARTMDLLLTTLLTSRYILWGKLRGLVSFCAPMLVGPVVVLLLIAIHGLLVSGPGAGIWLESSIELAVLMLIYTGLACVVALQISLKSHSNMMAVMSSMGTMLLLFGLVSVVGYAIVNAAGEEVGAFFAPFSPYTAVVFLVDPSGLFISGTSFTGHEIPTRVTMFIGSVFAAGAYAAIVFSLYRSLVRNFDMIVRRQSGQ